MSPDTAGAGAHALVHSMQTGRKGARAARAAGALARPDARRQTLKTPTQPLRRAGQPAWLLAQLSTGFTLLVFGARAAAAECAAGRIAATVLSVGDDLDDVDGLIARRYDGRPGTVYLIRPDHHVAARWRSFDAARIEAAIARACGG